jgi:nitroimidazol reductase NimA-like FMN-containing flavoprotein (pyridoxamine 5'-phosphate oxidase superfamily)
MLRTQGTPAVRNHKGEKYMRRNDRAVMSRTGLEQILEGGTVCHVALNTGAAPYIVPLNYGFSWDTELKLYFHCATAGRKLDLSAADNRAGFEIDRALELIKGPAACDWGMKYESVAGTGLITELTDDAEKIPALNLLMTHYGFPGVPSYTDAMLHAVKILCLTVQEITGKAHR